MSQKSMISNMKQILFTGAPYMMQPGGPMPQMPQPGMQPPPLQGNFLQLFSKYVPEMRLCS